MMKEILAVGALAGVLYANVIGIGQTVPEHIRVYGSKIEQAWETAQQSIKTQDYAIARTELERIGTLFEELDRNTGMWHLIFKDGRDLQRIISNASKLEQSLNELQDYL